MVKLSSAESLEEERDRMLAVKIIFKGGADPCRVIILFDY